MIKKKATLKRDHRRKRYEEGCSVENSRGTKNSKGGTSQKQFNRSHFNDHPWQGGVVLVDPLLRPSGILLRIVSSIQYPNYSS